MQILATVRQHGGRATLARRILLRALLDNPGHHSAEQLAAAVQAHAPSQRLHHLPQPRRTRTAPHHRPRPHRPRARHLPPRHRRARSPGLRNCGSMTEGPSIIFASLAQTARTRYSFTITPTASPSPACAPTATNPRELRRVGYTRDMAQSPIERASVAAGRS